MTKKGSKWAAPYVPSPIVDLIPTPEQLDAILPTLRSAKHTPVCRRCKGFKHPGRCVTKFSAS
ncbi:MAG: hypothetical protein KGI60_03690 [Patescibacteria group bacterium]|nr:hypothetical protein [Patescibacteria group bacterium]